jgi:hypothetical protein
MLVQYALNMFPLETFDLRGPCLEWCMAVGEMIKGRDDLVGGEAGVFSGDADVADAVIG